MAVVGLVVGVPEDTTLDSFADTDTGSENPPAVEVSSAVSTAAWSATAVACPRCETMVHRRYRTEDGQLVCIDCKRW